ncbi:MAG: GTP-binding protein [Lawsonibacter sp.]
MDFSAEMERTLQVLDYAILVISATDGVQAHTATLWRLLAGATTSPPSCSSTRWTWRARTGPPCWRSSQPAQRTAVWTSSAGTGPGPRRVPPCATTGLLEKYLEEGSLDDRDVISGSIRHRAGCFPAGFGAALRLDGVAELSPGPGQYCTQALVYPRSSAPGL